MVAYRSSKFRVLLNCLICAIGCVFCTTMLVLLFKPNLDSQLIIPIGVLMFIANYIAFIEPLLLGEVNLNYFGT